jgi:UrcA family protein
MKSIKYLLPLVALAASGIASAATRDAPGVVVRFGNLDLNSQAGVASLHKRIRNAAQSVCGPLETRILGLRDAYDVCVNEAVSNGVAAVANPNLSIFHASKGKGVVVASN